MLGLSIIAVKGGCDCLAGIIAERSELAMRRKYRQKRCQDGNNKKTTRRQSQSQYAGRCQGKEHHAGKGQ